VLQEALEAGGEGPLIALCGHVRSRRSLGRSLAFIDLELLGADTQAGADGACVQAILRSTNGPGAAPRPEIIAPGARVAVLGRAKISPRGSQLLVALESRLLTAAPSPHGVRAALAALQEGHLTAEACARALTPPDAWEGSGDQGEGAGSGAVSAAWLTAALARVADGDAEALGAGLIEVVVEALRKAAPLEALAAANGAQPQLLVSEAAIYLSIYLSNVYICTYR